MAINLDVALNLDDSQYKSGVKSVEQSLKKFSTTPAFVKLKLDEGDFRKQYQDLIKASIKEIDKLNALEYKTKGGAVKIANSTGTMQSAYKYHLEMSQNEKLSKAERNRHAASELALRRHLNLVSLIGLETKAQAKIRAQERAMPARLEQAKRSGQVAAAKKRAYDAEFAEEKRQKKDDELYRRRYLAFAAEESKIEQERAARIAQLQREADQRAKATRNQYDQKIAAGTDTRTPELDALRRQYQEEERLAANAAKMEKQHSDESAKQLSNRVKARRNAKDIEVALENEKIAREKVSAAQERTNANRTKENIEKEIKALKDLKRAEDDLDKAQGKRKRNSRVSSATNQRIQELQTELDALRNNSNELNKQSGLLNRLGSLAARYFSIQQIVQFGRKIAETTGYFQKQQVALEGILQSATDARKVLNEISNFALQSPFRTDELVRFTKQLSAFGIDTADLFPTVKQLADISAGLGVDMDRIILAYGQVKSAAVLRGQELRQFTEAGIPMVEELAKRFTALNGELVTTADVFDLISKRQVPFEMVAKVMADMTAEGGRFYKMQENITETMHGQMEKLKDIWTLSLNDIGKSNDGFFMGIIKGLQVIAKNVKSIIRSLSASVITSVLVAIGREVLILTGRLKRTTAELRKIAELRRTLSANKTLFAGLGIGLAAGVIVGAISKIHEEATRLKRTFKEIEESTQRETEKMIRGFDELSRKITTLNRNSKEYKEAIETLTNNYDDFVNSDIINALKEQSSAANQTALAFGRIAENVKESILAYQEFKELQEKRNAARDAFVEEKQKGKFNIYGSISGDEQLKYLNKRAKDILGRDVEPTDVGDLFDEVYDRAVVQFADQDIHSKEKFVEIYTSLLERQFPELSKENKERISTEAWRNITHKRPIGPDYLQDLIDARKRVQNTEYYKINKLFGSADLSKVYGSAINKYNENEKAYRAVLTKTGKEGEDTIQSIMKGIVEAEVESLTKEGNTNQIKEVSTAYKNLNTILNDSKKTPREVMEAFNALFGTIGDSSRLHTLKQIGDLYKENVGIMTKEEYMLAQRMSNSSLFKNTSVKANGQSYSMQDFFEKYNPAANRDKTLQQIGEDIIKDYQDLKQKVALYPNDGVGSIFEDDVKYWREQMKVLEELASKKYYGVDLNNKKKGSGARGGYLQLFSSMFGLIKEAREAQKKLVEGTDGYTNALINNIEKLNNSPLKSFYDGGVDGNPFAGLLKTLEEYDLEGVFSASDFEGLKNKYIDNVGVDNISVADYEQIWMDLVAVIKEKADSLIGVKGQESNRQNLIALAQRMVAEQKKTFGIDEIEGIILENLKAITRIEADTEAIKKKYGYVNQLESSVGADAAYKLIYGEDYKRFDTRQVATDNINKLLSASREFGIMSTSPMKQLVNIMEDGVTLNLENLSQLHSIVIDLEKQANEKELNVNGKIVGVDAEFKQVTAYFVKAINDMIQAIIDESKKIIEATYTKSEKEGVELSNILTNYKNAISLIKEDEKLSSDEQKLTNHTQRKIEATQGFYNNILSTLGGKEIPEFLRVLFGSAEDNGLNKTGDFLNFVLGDKSLEGMIQNHYAKKFASKEMTGKEASMEVSKVTAQIALVDAIIKAVYQAISAITEFGQTVIGWMEKTNDVTRVVTTDVNGNKKTIKSAADLDYMNDMSTSDTTKYDGDKLQRQKQALQAVQTFNQHIMDGWEKLKSGDVLGAVFETIASIGDLIVDIFGISDSAREQTIQNYLSDIAKMEKSLQTLDFRSTFMSGFEALDEQSKKLEILQKQQEAYEKSYDEEMAKKNTDQDKLNEYGDAAAQKYREQLEIIKGFQQEIMGTADELSNSLTDSLVNAFRNGENAARSWRDAVNTYIGDVLTQMLLTQMIAPKIQDILDQWMYGFTSYTDKNGNLVTAAQQAKDAYGEDYDRIARERMRDEKNAQTTAQNLYGVGEETVDLLESLPEELQYYMKYASNSSTLKGGVSGISEDTARSLEGLSNSILMQQVIANGHLSSINNQFMAVVQTNWFNQMLQNTQQINQEVSSIKKLLNDNIIGATKINVKMN